MANFLDGASVLDPSGATVPYLGFTANGAKTGSSGPRLYGTYANLAAVNGVVTAPAGSLAMLADGTLAVNTDSATTWALLTNTIALSAVADPGNAGAIPVTGSGRVPLVTAAAETRTLAVPASAGLKLVLQMKTDGGDCVVTSAQTINAAGNTIMTFGDAGDVIVLESIELGGALRWRVTGNDGVALS
jgi:hypothetical protein